MGFPRILPIWEILFFYFSGWLKICFVIDRTGDSLESQNAVKIWYCPTFFIALFDACTINGISIIFCDKYRVRRVLYIDCFLRGTRRVGCEYHATVGVSHPTINKLYNAFRERIAELCETESPFENGEIELDESYLGARRVRGKRGRGAQGLHTAASTNRTLRHTSKN